MLSKNIKHIFAVSLNKGVADGASEDISKTISPEAAKKVTWLQRDTSDFVQMKELADEITSKTDRLDILVNNAGRGIMTYQLTDSGVDLHMATNHFGPAVLTSHLMPLMKKTASNGNTVRISFQASNAHQGAPSDVKFVSLDEMNQDLGPNGQYGRSKLANILYTRYLAKHLKVSHPNILVNCTHPGFVETKQSVKDIHEPYPIAGYAMSVGMSPFKKTQWEGAVPTMYTTTKTTNTGEYICPPAIPEPGSKQSQDEELGESLMKLTWQVVREKTYPQSAEKGCPFTFY